MPVRHKCHWYARSYGRSCSSFNTQLGPFYFTKLLLPALLAGAKSSPDGKARVVNTSSGMHLMNKLHFKVILDDKKRKKAGTQPLYALSKFVRGRFVPW